MWHERHKLGCFSRPSNSVGTSPYSAKKAKKRIKETMSKPMMVCMALVLVGFFLKGGEALPNIHFALDLLSSYDSQNTGEYLRKNTVEKAILPGLRMIGQHLLQVEKDDAAQTVWLKALTSVCGVLVGVGLVSLIAKKWMKPKAKAANNA